MNERFGVGENYLEPESWKPILDFEGCYEISNRGVIRSLHKAPHRIMKQHKDSDGYFQLALNNKGYEKLKKVHVLVLEAFKGRRPKGLLGCHNDGNNQNNYIGNLRWDTFEGNAKDKVKHGTDARGERNPSAKLTKNDVIDIKRKLALNHSQTSLGKMYGVTQALISRIKFGLAWNHVQI